MQEVTLVEEGEGEFYVVITDGATGKVNIDVETRDDGEELIEHLVRLGMCLTLL